MESQRRTTLSTFLVQIKLFLRLGTMKEIKVDTTVYRFTLFLSCLHKCGPFRDRKGLGHETEFKIF